MAKAAFRSAVFPAASRPCFLGVETSVTGRRWEERLDQPVKALALAQGLGIPEIVGRVLAGRGVAPEEAARFLEPSLRASLPDPSCLKDMDRAVARLAAAVTGGEGIAIFGDYDVDGATSAALLARFLSAVAAAPRIYVPDRIAEGYGPNSAALLRLGRGGARVVVTVDCGTAAFAALEAAAEAGIDVVVLDHHAAEPALPKALAVVNPNRLDEPRIAQGPQRLHQLAAVGVTFLLVVALNRALRKAGWYGRDGRAEPDPRQWLDLVALGTVCDVVPLTGLNRTLVARGLEVMSRRSNPGLAALCRVAGLEGRLDAYHAGFVLGPRINAGGRVGEADLGARLLTSDDPAVVAALATRLDDYNRTRRAIEAAVLEAAIAQVDEAGQPQGGALVCAAGEGWHPGVVGIVASRLKERSNLPALVIALDPATGLGRGSGRSLPGVDLGAAVIAARQAGLLISGGGHPMAAGLTVEGAKIPALRDFLETRLGAALAARPGPTLGLDGALHPGAATPELVAQLERCGPFGTGNAQPRFAVPAARILKAQVVGERHLRCILCGTDGARLSGIAFRALDSALGPALLRSGGLPLHVAGKLRPDTWAGRDSVQLIIDDAAPVGATPVPYQLENR